MKTILLDTNILLLPGQNHCDIVEEISHACDFQFELQILSGTLNELEKLSKGGSPKHSRAAKIGALIASSLKILPSEGHVDDALISHAASGCIIATADRELKLRVKALGGAVIFPRKGCQFQIEYYGTKRL